MGYPQRDNLTRGRIERIVQHLFESGESRLAELALLCRCKSPYARRFLVRLEDVGLVVNPRVGIYSLVWMGDETDLRKVSFPWLTTEPAMLEFSRESDGIVVRWVIDGVDDVGYVPFGEYSKYTAAARTSRVNVPCRAERVSWFHKLKGLFGR